MSDYSELCARLRHNCECDSETMYQCDSCTASYAIKSQAREIAELRAERDRNLAEATKLDVENTSLSRQAQSGIAEADFQRRRANGLNLQLAKQSAQIDALQLRITTLEADKAEASGQIETLDRMNNALRAKLEAAEKE